jgi:hypothetical protein
LSVTFSFKQLLIDTGATEDEAILLVHFLASMRARQTIETLMPQTRMMLAPQDYAAYLIARHRAGETD